MKKYKVLWIDDQWQEQDAFIERCEVLHDIEVVPCRFAIEGMKLFEHSLDEWSGVILDAKVLYESDAEVAKTKGLQYSIGKINELKHKRDVPYYILTGQPDLKNSELFAETYGSYYEKALDEDRLIADIIKNADQLLDTQIIHKYKDVFDIWPERRNEILGILRVLELLDTRNAACLNEIRKMIEDVMTRLNDAGILLGMWNGTNLSECSRHIGKLSVRGVDGLGELIPIYIARSFHSLIDITNPGSHRTELETCVKDGRAPYVVQNTILELLNVLSWCKYLPLKEDREATEALIQWSFTHKSGDQESKSDAIS